MPLIKGADELYFRGGSLDNTALKYSAKPVKSNPASLKDTKKEKASNPKQRSYTALEGKELNLGFVNLGKNHTLVSRKKSTQMIFLSVMLLE